MGMLGESRIDISVIVTVHNAEKYLCECLDSVLRQTFKNIEILCIDGGSTDASPQLLSEYALRDERIRIINDTNTSYGHKVNLGIKHAQGEYVSVLESDDMYHPEMLENLYTVAEQYYPDFVNADYLEFWEIDGSRHERLVRMYPDSDYNKLLESGKHPEDMRQILRYWTGIFKKTFLLENQIQMNESRGASFQDMSFRFLTSALAETSYHLRVPVYLYRTDNPFSSVYDPDKTVVIADEYAFLETELRKREIRDAYIWRQFYVWKYNDFYGNLVRFDREARRGLMERSCRELGLDRSFLEQQEIGKYSPAVDRFLRKSRKELQTEVEESFQKIEREKLHQEQMYRKIKNYKMVIFGCGVMGTSALANLYGARERICCFTDNNRNLWNSEKEDYVILSPKEAVERYSDALYIVANKFHAQDIVQQLHNMEIENDMIYIYGGK